MFEKEVCQYTCKEGVQRWYPMADRLSEKDEDLRQELLVEILDTINTHDYVTDELMYRRMLYKRKHYFRGDGTSIDTGSDRRKLPITLFPYTSEIDQYVDFTHSTLPLDEVAVENVCMERLREDLTDEERFYFDCRMSGLYRREIHEMGLNKYKHNALRDHIRAKYERAFAE